jgi:aryl-alcohol dehydrogenase-like predicted oxidoreductase
VGGYHGHVRLPVHPVLTRMAQKYQVSTYRIALAWLLAKGEHILPIPGASKPLSIEDSLKAIEVSLLPEDVATLDAIPDQR